MFRKGKGQTVPQKRGFFPRLLLIILAIFAAAAGWVFLTLPDVTGLKTENPKTTSLIRFRELQARKAGRKFTPSQDWVDFKEVPGLLKKSILVSEDASFYWHKGLDYEELKASIRKDIRERRFARGGSTITQQLAKNLFLSTRKTPWRKLREILIARRLENSLTKDRIFGLYLNVIELGEGIFGVQTGSRRWFGKDVSDLSLEEMVRLTAIIPRPLKTDPRENSGWMRFRGRWIADTLRTVKAISEGEQAALNLAFE
jgi:monofunctional biosynthetic peptidoglycan transglycosylase